MVCESVMFSNVVVEIAISCRSFVLGIISFSINQGIVREKSLSGLVGPVGCIICRLTFVSNPGSRRKDRRIIIREVGSWEKSQDPRLKSTLHRSVVHTFAKRRWDLLS